MMIYYILIIAILSLLFLSLILGLFQRKLDHQDNKSIVIEKEEEKEEIQETKEKPLVDESIEII